MNEPLWDWPVLVRAANGRSIGAPAASITGISIDSRSLSPGDLFVALKDQRDGHDFVPAAFAAGAAGALVAEGYRTQESDGPLLMVDDTLDGLRRIAAASRRRLDPEAKVIAVTGSVGKTTTKEMLRSALTRLGQTHAAEKSFNNHWGVPLTLARMPADAVFSVFEIGMNHAGEIAPLARLVSPDVAIVTTVEAVHLGQFASVEDIAEEKADIFLGLDADGTAIINADNPYFERLATRAGEHGCRVLTFGAAPKADVRLLDAVLGADGSDVTAEIQGRVMSYRIGAAGRHIVINSLAVAGALTAIGTDLETGLGGLAALAAPSGRGERIDLAIGDGRITVLDESYNAGPASMRAALATMALVDPGHTRRRVAVLGDMLELGEQAGAIHGALAEPIRDAEVDLVLACGDKMRCLIKSIGDRPDAVWRERSIELKPVVLDCVQPGDIVMIKGSNGSRMGLIVEALKARFGIAGTN